MSPKAGKSRALWRRVTATGMERLESEYTTFQSSDFAVTEDGRSIGFNVEIAMSHSFAEKADTLTGEQFVLTDPLIINRSGDTTSVSGTKFRFDLDADGEEESISFAGKGSGFLALDANGNGAIYLGSADTEFSFEDETTHETNGVMRRTGVYLRETGEAGTLSHVDLRC